MTKQEFVSEFRHHFGGLVLDALCSDVGQGAARSVFTRNILRKIDEALAEIYETMTKDKECKSGTKNC